MKTYIILVTDYDEPAKVLGAYSSRERAEEIMKKIGVEVSPETLACVVLDSEPDGFAAMAREHERCEARKEVDASAEQKRKNAEAQRVETAVVPPYRKQ